MDARWESGEHELKVLDPLQSALFAVSELVQSCRVVFDLEKHGGSYLEHRGDGRKTKVYPRNGTYVLPVWFKKRPNQAQLGAQLAELSVSGGDPFWGGPWRKSVWIHIRPGRDCFGPR